MSKPVIKALVIAPDSPARSGVRDIDQQLSTLQQLVGGYLEGVYGLDDARCPGDHFHQRGGQHLRSSPQPAGDPAWITSPPRCAATTCCAGQRCSSGRPTRPVHTTCRCPTMSSLFPAGEP